MSNYNCLTMMILRKCRANYEELTSLINSFCVTFGESNKAYAPYPALITPEQGERRVIEENDQFYDRERFCQP